MEKTIQMTDAAKIARREYKRAWNREHREQVKESQRKYWEKRAAAKEQPDEPKE